MTSININANDDYVFRVSCEYGHKAVAEWLYILNNDYKIIYENSKMLPHIRNIRTILKENNLKEIHELYENAKNLTSKNDDLCMIYLDDGNKYWIKLNCRHMICYQCFTCINECPYKCENGIDF